MSLSRFTSRFFCVLHFHLRYSLLYRDVTHFGDLVGPSVHDDSRRVGGEDDLHVGVEAENHVDELLLPVDMEAHLRLVHEEYIRLLVFDEHGEQDGQHLLLAAGELVGGEPFAYL